MNKRYGYKGQETSLNGIINWMDNNLKSCSQIQRYKWIIEFCIENGLHKPRRPLQYEKLHPNMLFPIAYKLAKKIQPHLFNQFIAYVQKSISAPIVDKRPVG